MGRILTRKKNKIKIKKNAKRKKVLNVFVEIGYVVISDQSSARTGAQFLSK